MSGTPVPVTAGTISQTESAALAALRTFIVSVMASAVGVYRGQGNRVPEPDEPDYVLMTVTMRERLATNSITYNDPGTPIGGARFSLQATKLTVQLDVHGPNSGDNAQVLSTLLRDGFACEGFRASGIAAAPLFASEPRQVPFINGEGQYEERWSVDAVLQINPVVTVPQQFAAQIKIKPVSVDTIRPVGVP